LVIAEDHNLVREGIEHMLSGEEDLLVLGQAKDGLEAVELCKRLEPDLVLMDVRMPRMDGLEATSIIKQENARTSVLMVTMQENPDYLFEALKAGAAGYILKGATRKELLGAIRAVFSGDTPLDSDISARLLRRLAAEGAERLPLPTRETPRVEPLTPRELEVLEHTKLGLTNREIARELSISRLTVKRHIEHIIAKLGVSDRTQAVVRALNLGLLDFSED
jgi:DNA-binding NarL/FixJ family response regulator